MGHEVEIAARIPVVEEIAFGERSLESQPSLHRRQAVTKTIEERPEHFARYPKVRRRRCLGALENQHGVTTIKQGTGALKGAVFGAFDVELDEIGSVYVVVNNDCIDGDGIACGEFVQPATARNCCDVETSGAASVATSSLDNFNAGIVASQRCREIGDRLKGHVFSARSQPDHVRQDRAGMRPDIYANRVRLEDRFHDSDRLGVVAVVLVGISTSLRSELQVPVKEQGERPDRGASDCFLHIHEMSALNKNGEASVTKGAPRIRAACAFPAAKPPIHYGGRGTLSPNGSPGCDGCTAYPGVLRDAQS